MTLRQMLTELGLLMGFILVCLTLAFLVLQQPDRTHQQILLGVVLFMGGLMIGIPPFIFARWRRPSRYPQDRLRRAQHFLWLIPQKAVALLAIGTAVLIIAAAVFHFYLPPELLDVYMISWIVILLVVVAALALTVFNIFRLKEHFEL